MTKIYMDLALNSLVDITVLCDVINAIHIITFKYITICKLLLVVIHDNIGICIHQIYCQQCIRYDAGR